ncbi:MAG: metallophosphoesterase [Kiritimatiellae bacterium]|nr:metallophosphoesterase [Kiritimatiellia bacterium]
MTNAALRGKPDAGNPHVRFDEVEAALTATSRRGSLLYTRRGFVGLAAGAALCANGVCDTGAPKDKPLTDNDPAGASAAAGEASPAMFDKAAGVVRIPKGERLRILQLTDTQIIDSAQRRSPKRLSPSEIKKWLPENAEANCYSHIRDLVAQTCPHLIIMTGDNVYGEFDDSGRVLAEFIGFMDSLGIPWAPIWGNHDQESAVGNAAMCAAYGAASNCLFRTETENPADGTGNYAVRIYQGGKLVEMVYMLDSHGCSRAAEKSIRIPRSITENQCRMMERLAKEAEREAGRPVPAIAAWHIPTKEFFGACKALGYPTKVGTVIGVTVPARPGDFGAIQETSIPTATPERFAERLRGCGVNAVFAGHCHKINISVMWNGIRWTMGMKTGTYDYHINGAIGGTLAEFHDGVPTVRHIPTLAGY